MINVLVLGASGMLGNAVSLEFSNAEFNLTLSSRPQSRQFLPDFGQQITFDALTDEVEKLNLSNFDYVINCIGIVKSKINDRDFATRESAILVNSLFPSRLAAHAVQSSTRVIQIATDCVFSGDLGSYSENSEHDATDVYGKTKSLGETPSPAVMHLRVSTVGPELGRSSLLLEWVRQQPKNAKVAGYTDHKWNGITTKAFAKIARGIIQDQLFTAGVQHIVPSDEVTKAELVELIAKAYGRSDLEIQPGESGQAINRTLSTTNPGLNLKIWDSAGYKVPPTISELLAEIAA